MSELPLEDRLHEAAKLAERMTAPGADGPVGQLKEDLGVRIADLQDAKAAYAAAVRDAAAARVREELAQLNLRRALGANRGKLIELYHGDLRAAAAFFRPEPRRAKPNGATNGQQAATNGQQASAPTHSEEPSTPDPAAPATAP